MRAAIDGKATAIMLLLCLIWGGQQVAIKVVAVDMAPVMQVALRSGLAALLVWLFSRVFTRDRWLPGIGLRSGLAAGALFAAEFLLVAEGLRWTSASHMALFLYTSPLFAAVGLHLKLREERLTGWQWLGMCLAFAGIAVTFIAPQAAVGGDPALPRQWWGDFLGLCAGASWGMTTVVVRTTRLSNAPPTQTLFCQLATAFILLLFVAVASGQSAFHGSRLVWVSLGFQTIVVSFASYLIWFWLLRRYLAARLGVLTFMTPLFGLLLGVLVLHEHIDASFLAGAALALAGLVMVNTKGKAAG